jgi:hypothetical protein
MILRRFLQKTPIIIAKIIKNVKKIAKNIAFYVFFYWKIAFLTIFCQKIGICG